MKQRNVGNSGVKVSLLGLGCNNFGLRMPVEDSQAVIKKALDVGITFFDTADVYGQRGGSETALGQYLGSRLKDVFIATKFGNAMDEEGKLRGGSRAYVRQAIEASLKRLKRDWIDLYQMHRPDPKVPIEETLRTLDDLVKEGKIRYIGFSQLAGWELADRHWIARHNGLNPVTAVEIEYSLLNRDPERELVPAMRQYGVGLLPFYPLASGFLTGKYKRGAPLPEGGRLTKGKSYADLFMTDSNWTVLERLEAFCAARGRNLLELALSWLAAQPVMLSVIAGATRAEQVAANVKAIDWELTSQELAEIDGITGKPPASGRTQRRTA
ncbi:MAG TPA: aldo/keto reductase [Burkholderiales bacterium]|nr:aldo/keto reductase [Burkholderiales bacterium]